MILFSILFTYVLIGRLSVTVSYFLMIHSKYLWISDTDYDTSGNSNLLFHVGADMLNLLFLYNFILSMFSIWWDLINQNIYHFFLKLFHLKDWVIVYED